MNTLADANLLEATIRWLIGMTGFVTMLIVLGLFYSWLTRKDWDAVPLHKAEAIHVRQAPEDREEVGAEVRKQGAPEEEALVVVGQLDPATY